MSGGSTIPRFPGRELLVWTKHLLRIAGQACARAAKRVRAIPKERWYSALAIIGMFVLVLVLGGLVGTLLLNPLLWGAIFAAITLSYMIFSIFTSTNLKLTLAKAERATEEHSRLVREVKELSLRAGIPAPSVWIANRDDLNAYVCGRSPKRAALVMHRGGLDHWTDEQLRGVLAHELAHIRNRDVLAMTIAVSLYESMTWICRVYLGGVLGAVDWYGKLAERSSGFIKLIGYACWLAGWGLFWATYVLLILLIRPAGMLLSLSASRQQEYLADRRAAEMLGSGETLASALLAIEAAHDASGPDDVPAQRGAKQNWRDKLKPPGGWANVWSTHPPTSRRVELLRHLDLDLQAQAPEVQIG